MKTLFLIDANSLIHRAFHALPPLTSPDGKPTQALYGLASILLKLRREETFEYAAALFDRPEPTFRKKEYAEYKAQRPKAADELISQIIEAHNLFAAFGIQTLEKPGFEADDLIATCAEKFKKTPDTKIVILTGDMDTLQLVEGETVVVRALKRGISDTVMYTKDAVRERYGLSPEQLIDYKALVGDPSDNIKGVPGVGPKTAVALLQKFGTLENIYKNIAKTGTIGAKLKTFEKEAWQSKRLVTLVRDADVGVSGVTDTKIDFNPDRLQAYFKSLGFETLIARLVAPKAHADGGQARIGGEANKGVEHMAPTVKKKEAQGKMF